ncbi:MAG: COX15/CtaA family protein [Actinomycetota bacterium]
MSATIDTTSRADAVSDGRAPAGLRRLFFANLIAQMAIVVTGGIVRLTGSGLGCPTWPECVDGSYVPTSRQEEAWHKYVEFGNRLLTFVLGLLAIAAIVAALAWWRRRTRAGLPGRGPVVVLAAVPLVGTVVQALLGGVTVLTGLNPWAVAGHFLVSILIIAGCAVLVVRAGEPGDEPVTPLVSAPIRWLGRALVAVTLVVVVLGVIVTGSGPHSGDADTEARFGVDPRTMSWLHADSVLLFLGLTVGMIVALHVTQAPRQARRAAWWLLGAALAQGLVGYTQYFTGLPWVLVALHMLGATLVWVLAVVLLLRLRSRGAVSVAA